MKHTHSGGQLAGLSFFHELLPWQIPFHPHPPFSGPATIALCRAAVLFPGRIQLPPLVGSLWPTPMLG